VHLRDPADGARAAGLTPTNTATTGSLFPPRPLSGLVPDWYPEPDHPSWGAASSHRLAQVPVTLPRMRLPRFLQGRPELHVDAPEYDGWAVVEDYEDLQTARAFRDRLRELGLQAELTSDHPLDRFGRGDIALRVPDGQYGDATVALDGLDLD
jgi:hypothetical protein